MHRLLDQIHHLQQQIQPSSSSLFVWLLVHLQELHNLLVQLVQMIELNHLLVQLMHMVVDLVHLMVEVAPTSRQKKFRKYC